MDTLRFKITMIVHDMGSSIIVQEPVTSQSFLQAVEIDERSCPSRSRKGAHCRINSTSGTSRGCRRPDGHFMCFENRKKLTLSAVQR
jgi:hypothetical protein